MIDMIVSTHVGCFSEVTVSDRSELFVKKLHQCAVVFDFNDASSELKGKQIKAAALHEMLDYITTQRGVITEPIYPEVIKMVCSFSTPTSTGFLTMTTAANHPLRLLVLYKSLPIYTPSSESYR